MAEDNSKSQALPRNLLDHALNATKIEQICSILLGKCIFAPIGQCLRSSASRDFRTNTRFLFQLDLRMIWNCRLDWDVCTKYRPAIMTLMFRSQQTIYDKQCTSDRPSVIYHVCVQRALANKSLSHAPNIDG